MSEKKFWLFIALSISIITIMVYFLFFHSSKPLPEIEKPTLENIEIKAYEAFMERCKLLISLATALIGAIGFLLIWEKKGEIETNYFQKLFIIISATIAGFSIYLGYITYSRITEFLSHKMFNLSNPYIESPVSWQFWTFLFSIIFFIAFIFTDLFSSKKKLKGET